MEALIVNVFIVEDEPLLLNNIKNMIEKAHPLFKVVGTAYDGDEALSKIDSLRPDVIFTDIRMPIMDGLTLIEKLIEKKYLAIPVILSGYQEFDYAKKAMKLGVYDYLLKPLSPDSLSELLNKLYNKITILKKNYQIETLEKLLHLSTNSQLSTDDYMFSFPKFNYYYYVLICSGSYCISPTSWITSDEEFFVKNDLESIVLNHLGNQLSFWLINGDHSNEKILFCGVEDEKLVEIGNCIQNLYNYLRSKDIPITCVVELVNCNLNELREIANNSKLTLNKNLIFSKSSIIYLSDNSKKNVDTNISFKDWDSIERIFTILIKNGQEKSLYKELLDIIVECEKQNYKQFNLEKLLKFILNLFYSNIDYLQESRTIEIDMELNELISNTYSYKELFAGICPILDDLFNISKKKNREFDNQLVFVDTVEQYINSFYMKQISLQSLSQTFGLVAPYLSRLYKKAKGISPTDFITQLRVNKVKELLDMDPSINLKDIAETVGFSDAFYLSKVFKATIGISPSEYKQSKKL